MEKFKTEELKSMNLYDLRILGAKIGVRAPTLKNKFDLINAIIEVSSGITEPYKTNVGRPSNSRVRLSENPQVIEKAVQIVAEQKTQKELYEKAVDKMLNNLKTFLMLHYDET